jgi:hypothetical protein
MTSAARRSPAHRWRVFADMTGIVWLSRTTVARRAAPHAPAGPLGPARSVALPLHPAVLCGPPPFNAHNPSIRVAV